MRKIQNAELSRLSVDDFKLAHKRPVTIVLDNVRSLNNIGSVFRTADAFLCSQIILCGISATPPHREIHKTALGAEDSVQWIYEKDITVALQILKSHNTTIICIEQIEGGCWLNDFKPDPEKKYAFVFGNEIHGVSEAALPFCDFALEIPQQGTKHSLNVAVSAGIVLWDYFSKIRP